MTGHLELWVLGLLAAVAGLVMLSTSVTVAVVAHLVIGLPWGGDRLADRPGGGDGRGWTSEGAAPDRDDTRG
jgi:hypothetical protein